MIYDLTGRTASSTYMRLVQVVDGVYYDGLGFPLDIGSIGPTGPQGPQGLVGPTGPAGSGISGGGFTVDGGTPSTSSTGIFRIDFGGIN